MKKLNLSHKTHLLRIAAILCLLSSYLWIAPSQIHALSADSQDHVLGKEQTYMAGEATADNQMAYYDRWKSGYETGLRSSVFASDREQTQPQTFALSLGEHLWSTDPLQTDSLSLSISKGDVPQAPGESNPSAPLRQDTTLAVDIISSPWAVLDHNHPEEGPRAFVVEAVITNTGGETATDLVVTLDYYDPANDEWVLLSGEEQDRKEKELADGEAYHAYWFATYPPTLTLSHQYTVTAWATNAVTVTTSDNYYNPTGPTVEISRTLSGGSTRLSESTTDIVVGVAFTATVEWDLGTNFQELIFSPVGNVDFDPSSYRLVASRVTFLDSSSTPITTAYDRLYFPTVPASTQYARGEFVFLALRPTVTTLCPYVAPFYANDFKYDNDYCKPGIPLTGTLSISLTKQAGDLIQQGQPLTYTLHYTNNGDLPLLFSWIWDDVDTNIGSIISTSIDPPADEHTESHVAWDLGTIPPDDTDTLTFAIRIDGNGTDLADNTSLVNHALFGIARGGLPTKAALTSTVTTTIQAPTIALSKTDGQETAGPGDALIYTLRITNSGSITATGLVITDVLPTDVNYTPGTASDPETGGTGQTLVWDDQGPIAPGGGTVVITIPVTVDSGVLDETILTNTMTVKYENLAGHIFATKTATDTTTVHLPPTVYFTAASQSGAEDVGTMTVTAQLNKVSDLDVTVPFTLSGTATEGVGQDYTITSSPVTITAGSLSTSITINVNDDDLDEDAETVIVTMGTPINATKGVTDTHTATITDNDAEPTVYFTAASQSGSEDVGTMTVTAELDAVSGLDVTIPFTVGGTATEGVGQDYTITSSPVTITAGSLTTSIIITVNDDSLPEADETVIVTMGTPVNATKGVTDTHTATITDNEARPTVYFTAASQSRSEDVGTMTVTAELDAVSSLDVTIPFTLSGTATQGAGQDYTITSSPVVIPAGSLTAIITINVNDDDLDEDAETVIVTMGTPTNANKGTPSVHTATITDNDAQPTVYFTAASQSRSEGVGTMTITAQLNKVSGLDVTVPFVVGGTATQGAGQDYTITSSPVVIPAGSLSAIITINVNDDDLDEDAETVIVTMGTPTNANKGTPSVHTATITDNDAQPTVYFTAASQSRSEGVGTMTITARLDRVSGLDVTVPFVVGGTATQGVGQDYTITSSPVVIPAGSLTAIITINVNDDSLYEANETVIVTMGTPTNANKGTPSVHTATITDNDGAQKPTVDFSSATYSVDEGASIATITVTLDASSTLAVTVDYATSDGTATAGSDYTAGSGTLTFNPGVIIRTFTVAITDDALAEGNETVTLTLSNVSNANLDGNNPATLTIMDDDTNIYLPIILMNY